MEIGERDVSDARLVRLLPGRFENGFAEVNGTRLHYVAGGQGRPLFLLPGWPQTWWSFHKVMPALAERYRVVAVDIRGMGGSAKPEGGYDKKNMARDVRELARDLGYEKIDIAGHDVGGTVAYSFAANYAGEAGKIALLDAAHPHEGFNQLTLLPGAGQRVNPGPLGGRPFQWWYAFNQLQDLPERLLSGRSRYLIDWLLDYGGVGRDVIDDHDRTVYASAYSDPEAIRAGNRWYQAFQQDIADEKNYGTLLTPILALCSRWSFEPLRAVLPQKAYNAEVVLVENSGHHVAEEQPELVITHLTRFFG
jgi:pimeloyl-ACP methyl ester carboxylesterase